MALRVALLGLYHESNTFISSFTTVEDFRNGHWLTGEAIRSEYQQAFHEIGGMLEVMDLQGIEVVPVMYAEATPGGMLDSATFDTLCEQMFQQLDLVLPVDGCLVVPHGAGVSERYRDMDGEWLTRLRQKLGPGIPIIGSLDPHANVSQQMVDATDALVAYKTNPHIDQRETGKEAAMLMAGTLKQVIQPVNYFVQLPMAMSIEQQFTGSEPCLGLYQCARDLLDRPGVISTTILLGFPYADVAEMGSAFILVADGKSDEAQKAVDDLLAYATEKKRFFNGVKRSINEELPLMKHYAKPILLLDMGDNIGGGSSGTSTHLLKALEQDGSFKSFICICDAAAVAEAIKHQPGDSFPCSFGREFETHGDPVSVEVKLMSVHEGKFSESSPRHGGQVNFDMGQTAVVQTTAGNVVMLTSRRVPPFSLQQLLCAGLQPGDFDAIVAKGVNAPIAAYAPVCKPMLQIDTPGCTRADMTRFSYKNRRKPLFPFEDQAEAV